MFTPMKMPRTMNEQYAMIRAADDDQRKRKTSVKKEVTPSVCRRMILTPTQAIHTIQIPCEEQHIISVTSCTTPHARSFESKPNDAW